QAAALSRRTRTGGRGFTAQLAYPKALRDTISGTRHGIIHRAPDFRPAARPAVRRSALGAFDWTAVAAGARVRPAPERPALGPRGCRPDAGTDPRSAGGDRPFDGWAHCL